MSKTLKYDSKNSQKNNFNYFLENFPLTESLQNSSNFTNINKIFGSLFGQFSSNKEINICFNDLNTELHYFYRKAIFKKLYEVEENINIKLNIEIPENIESNVDEKSFVNSTSIDIYNFKYKIYSLFYLDLLITENSDMINYSYPYELIIKIKNSFKKNKHKSPYLKIIESKIIIDLINNFQGLDECNKNLYIIYLEDIKEENIKIFESYSNQLKLNYSSEDNIKIDQIYADIINSIIEQDNSNFQNIEKLLSILIELDLNKIDITQTMINNFSNLLTENNRTLYEYKINSIDDFINVNKINFYYILLKYVFKKSYLIYQIPFLLSTRNSLLKSLNNYLNGNSSLKFDEKSKYVLETILDSHYYSEKILNFNKEVKIYPQKFENITSHESNDDIFGESLEDTIISNSVKEVEGNFVNKDVPFLVYNEKSLYAYDIKYNNINLNSSIKNNDFSCICQTSTNSGENKNQYISCSKESIILFIVNNEKIHEKMRVKIPGCSLIFEMSKNLYLVCGLFGIKILDGKLREKKEYENNKFKDKIFRSGIVIEQNIIALVYSNLENLSKNKLVFYNFHSKEIVFEIDGYSFLQSQKSLILFPEDKPRILMCSYENENNKEKGILFIDLDILNKVDSENNIINKKIESSNYIYFYNSNNFKINCFCFLQNQIFDINNSNKGDKIYVQYFLAGGHEEIKENEKDKDIIHIFGQANLYQMIYISSNFIIKIEKEEEIRPDKIENSISSMILTKENQNLLINCDKKAYVYKKPNINYYLQNNDITT